MQCPECKDELGARATYCQCGWKKSAQRAQPPAVHISCAHADCGIRAMCKIKTKTGWANLCWQHYDKHYADEAHANLDKYGLACLPDETTEEHVSRMREFVKSGLKRFAGRARAA